jgi:hypothetical protein
MFIHKPVIYIKHSSLKYVEFSRLNSSGIGSNRTFDLSFVLMDGTEHQFINLDQTEIKVLMKYFKSSGIKMREVDCESKRGHDLEEEDEDELKGRGYKRKVEQEDDEMEYDDEDEEEDGDFDEKE